MKCLTTLQMLVGVTALVPLSAGDAHAADPASAGRYAVYVSLGGIEQIAIYNMDPRTGALTDRRTMEVGGAPGSLAVDPERRFLYAALRSNDSAAALRIDPNTGNLAVVGTTPLAGNPVYLAVDHSGKLLLMSSYSADKAAVYRIRKDGKVDPEATQVLSTEHNPHSIGMDLENSHVFIPNTGSDSILQFRLDAGSGTLVASGTPKVTTDKGSGPRHFCFHPGGRFVYFVNEKNSSVTGFTLDKRSGTLAAIQSISTLPDDFQGQNTCADIHVTPDGKFVYASNRGHDSLAGYAVNPSTGKLTALGQTPTEKTPRDFDIDPTGKFVYAAGQSSDRMASYRIDPQTGKLQPLTVYEVGKGPAWVSVVRMP